MEHHDAVDLVLQGRQPLRGIPSNDVQIDRIEKIAAYKGVEPIVEIGKPRRIARMQYEKPETVA
jgi:hypothetical protein